MQYLKLSTSPSWTLNRATSIAVILIITIGFLIMIFNFNINDNDGQSLIREKIYESQLQPNQLDSLPSDIGKSEAVIQALEMAKKCKTHFGKLN